MRIEIKEQCVGRGCTNKLYGGISRYNLQGNFCPKCTSEVNQSLKSKRRIGLSLQQKLINRGILKN